MKYLILLLALFATPSFALTLYVDKNTQTMRGVHDGVTVFESKVVIGRADRQTPNFEDVISHVVTAPTWNVPYNLAQKDVLPDIRRNPALLSNGNFRILNGAGNNVTAQFRANGMKLRSGWRIQQAGGPRNALGAVKFMLRDKMAYGPPIFLHDTNHKELFARENRRYSSGCIRIEKAVELSELLGVTVRSGRERWHKLDVPVRVVVTGN